MLHNLTNTIKATVLMILFSSQFTNAQVATNYSFSYNTSTYTAISGGTTLASGTGASMDDALYTGVPIGFTFKYNNVNYTTVGVSTNGFIWFGTNDPLSTTYTPISYAGSMDGAVSVFGRDLIGHPAGSVTPVLRYATTGTAPNRIFTVEWFCVRAKTFTSGSGLCALLGYNDINRMDLQIILYESEGYRIDMRQRIAPYCLDGSFNGQVGLRGNVNTDYNNRFVNCSGNSWASPASGSSNTSTCTMSESPSCYPVATAVYTWAPPPPPTPVQCDYSFSYSTSTAYSALPVTGPTTLITGTTGNPFRYGAWPNQSLGFTFVYNGQNYTEIGVSSKGYIWFGPNNPTNIGTPSMLPLTMALNSTMNIEGIVAGLNADWVGRSFSTNTTGGAGGAIRTQLTGSAPNRIFIIEWSNVRPNGAADGTSGNPNLRRTDFQILLYETTNVIAIAFNVNPYPYTSYSQTFQCGLRANTNTNTHVRRVNPGSGGAGWAGSLLGTSTSTVTIEVSGSTYPPTNARFIFTPTGAPVTCTWNGSTSYDWHTASNWTPAIVPTTCNNVVIPIIGSGVYPQIGVSTNNHAYCRNLTVNSGAYLNTLIGYTGKLNVYGDLTNNGMIVVDGDNPISLAGGLNKTISGTGNNTLARYTLSEASTYLLQNDLDNYPSAIYELNILSGCTLNMNNHNLKVYAMNQTGQLKQGSGTLSIEGPTASYTLTASTFVPETGTTYFSSGDLWGPANQTVPSLSYHHIKIRSNNSYTVTLGSSADFSCNNLEIINPGSAGGIVTTARNLLAAGNLSIGILPDEGVSLMLNHCIYRSTGTGTFTMGDSDDNIITVTKPTATGPHAAALHGYGTLNFYGTVIYDSGSPQTVMTGNYKNIEISGGSGVRSMNGPITVSNDLTISSGTLNAVNTSNSITISGDWINTATYTHNGNTVTFNGSTIQDLQAGSSEFYNLVIDGSGVALVIDDASVGNKLTLTDGLIHSGTQKLIISNDATTSLEAGAGNTDYTQSWINGTLRRFVNSSGDYEFPVGNDLVSQNGVLTLNSLLGTTYIDAWFRPLANHLDGDMSLNETGIIGNPAPHPYYTVNAAGCWVFEPDAQPTGGTYDIKLFMNGFSGLQNNRFGIVKRPENSTTAADWNTGGGQLNADNGDGRMVADGYAIRLNLNSFSEFGIGQFNGSPLPVLLTQFWGTKEVNGNVLHWITESELNSDYYAIEHSIDGKLFNVIGTISAKGYSQERNVYVFRDEARTGKHYYRLKCVDTDRSYTYSPVALIERDVLFDDLNLYPNPARQYIRMEIKANESSEAVIRIIDITGKEILTHCLHNNKGSNTYTIHVSDLAPGVYLLDITYATDRQIKIFVKE